MRVLLLCDDYWHPGDVPEKGLAPLSEKGIVFDVVKDAKELNLEALKNYAVVIMSKSDNTSKEDETPWRTEAVQQAFVDYVENGGGFMTTHSGTVPGKNTAKLEKLIGCRFISHPAQAMVTVQPIKPHPITDGVGIWAEMDEPYIIEILQDDANILAGAYAPPEDGEGLGIIAAAGYVRTQGKGRICVFTPGHNLEVWHNAEYQKMLFNGIRWCAGIV